MKVVKIKRAIARMKEGSESFRYYVPEMKTALVRDKQCRGGSRAVVGKKSYDAKVVGSSHSRSELCRLSRKFEAFRLGC